MASVSGYTESEIDSLVSALSLQDFYPEKLTREHLYEITDLSLEDRQNVTQSNIARHFINRVTRLNSNARGLKLSLSVTREKPLGYRERMKQAKLKTATDFHPLDIQVAVFLCCDPIAKQDLVSFLWDCKLAVPFILQPEKSNHPMLYKWPLRQLVTQWQDKTDVTSKEYPIYEYPMSNIGFVRIGHCDESKSQLINGIIGGPEKALGPMFFHRDFTGSKRQRSPVIDGLVELAWYFPKGSATDTFGHCMSFMNLRGDAVQHTEQTEFLCRVLNIVIVITHSSYLKKSRDILNNFLISQSKVILIVTDKVITEETDDIIKGSLINIDEHGQDKFEILTFEESRLAEKLDMITDQIKNMVSNDKKSIAEYCNKQFTSHIQVDENSCDNFLKGLQRAKQIVEHLKKTPETERKEKYLPSQGRCWRQWAKTDIEIYRLNEFQQVTGQDIASYRDKLECSKSKLRDEQVRLIETAPSSIMLYFISSMHLLKYDEIQIFLRTLKLELNNLSRKTLQTCYKSYQRILDKKQQGNETESAVLNRKLEELDEHKSTLAFGLEHICRELGQIFEAYTLKRGIDSLIKISKSCSIQCSEIPLIASTLLLHGYPIEIMDGDVGFVPEVWLKHVLLATQRVLRKKIGHEPKLHIISVLGIQSSGKSTLLNTMFGLQFAVSAGRCTKGAYMQMIKLSETLSEKLQCDYLVAIDTEGLRSAQLSSLHSVIYDNELSCFAIGLSDTTIVNLMGENATYLEENLPIVVHAFLRMNMAGLKPLCTIVHHNVDKRNKDKLSDQSRLLEKVLNDLTKKACDIEKISPPKRFKDIISFDLNGHTDYIPSLFEGEQPMAPISIGYSNECNILRQKLVCQIEVSSRKMTIRQFSTHVRNLWNAIKQDNFVFEFKSTLEMETRLRLDEFMITLYSDLYELTQSVRKKSRDRILQCTQIVEMDDIFESTLKGATHELDSITAGITLKLNKYMDDPNNRGICTVRSEKENTLKSVDLDLHKEREDVLNEIRTLFESEVSEKNTFKLKNINSDDIKVLKDIIDRQKSKHPYSSIGSLIEKIWDQWKQFIIKEELETQTKPSNMSNILGDAEKTVYKIFSSNKILLDTALKKKPLKMHTLNDFIIGMKYIHPHHSAVTRSEKNERLEILNTIKKNIFNNVKYQLKVVREENKKYSATIIRKLIVDMKKMTDRNKYTCSNDFVTDVTLAVVGYAVTNLTEMNNVNNEYTDKINSLEKKKPEFVQLIKFYINDTKTKVEEVSEIIFRKLLNKLLIQIGKELPYSNSLAKSQKCITKRKMRTLLLYEAVVKNDKTMMDLYCADAESAFKVFIRNSYSTEHLIADAQAIFKNHFATLCHILKQKVSSKSLVSWLHHVFRCFQLQYNPKEHQELELITDVDVSAVSQCVLEKMAPEICEYVSEYVHVNCDMLKENITRTVASNCNGCNERCPFCNEVCMYSYAPHIGQHETTFHRPIYYRDKMDNVHLETCAYLVGSDELFTVQQLVVSTKTHKLLLQYLSSFPKRTLPENQNIVNIKDLTLQFKRYKLLYPTWMIRAVSKLEASMFWKWYFVNMYTLSAESDEKIYYPSSWNTITKLDVLQQLFAHG